MEAAASRRWCWWAPVLLSPLLLLPGVRTVFIAVYWSLDYIAHTIARPPFWPEIRDVFRLDAVALPPAPFRGRYVGHTASPLRVSQDVPAHHLVRYTEEGTYFGAREWGMPSRSFIRDRGPHNLTCFGRTWKGAKARIVLLKNHPAPHPDEERHIRVFHAADWKSLRALRAADRQRNDVFVLYNLESPVHMRATLGVQYMRQFDISMSYRTDSHVFVPYFDSLDTRKGLTAPANVRALWRQRNASGLLLTTAVSNCRDFAGRAHYVRTLARLLGRRFTNIGRCHRTPAPPNVALDKLVRSSFFYLAVENSNCEDYVTEKLARAINNKAVPVVFSPPQSVAGGPDSTRVPDYDAWMPRDTYVNVADFDSAEALVAHLERVAADEELYAKYLWTHGKPVTKVVNAMRRQHTARRGHQHQLPECRVAEVALAQRPERSFAPLLPDESCLPSGQMCHFLRRGTCTADAAARRVGALSYPLRATSSAHFEPTDR